ncbi:hypothetical protein PR048_022236 [Dryococelus australis]|uniref:UDP-glucuronosyltransferase n=1 Tax=Dryococelus australis TaxID=614101 RepID=A0ABQ9H0J5_9NEOP|nr:hypothetical protein PR048_022236 [Dryococelus australis]
MIHSMFNSRLLQLLVICVPLCDAARILGIAPFDSSSHSIVMSSLFKELANRGHQMTVYTVKPLKHVPSNYSQITIDIKQKYSGGRENFFEILYDMSALALMGFMWSISSEMATTLLESPDLKKLLHSSNDKFDLFITESFFNDALLGFSHKFDVPFVCVVAFSGTEGFKDSVGNPFPYSYVPNPFFNYNDNMTFFQRLHNTITNFLTKVGHNLYYIPAQDAVMRKYFTNVPNLPPLADIIHNTSLLLLNTHFSHEFPRPNVPNLIEVGGMHVKPSKKLPQDIQKYLDDAKDGVVYFSMGSNLKSSNIDVDKREALLNAFAKLKQRVMWKFEENLPRIPQNVKIYKWLPQSDILGHPNVRVFMTHGGLLSTQEAMYNAVPLVGVPIFGDQILNVFRAVEIGYALQLDYHNITEESVYWTLNEVVTNPK